MDKCGIALEILHVLLLNVSMSALQQCGSSLRAAGRVGTSSGACDTWRPQMDSPITGSRCRYHSVFNLAQTQLGFGQDTSVINSQKNR